MVRVDRDLLSRWNIQRQPDPDFGRLRQAIRDCAPGGGYAFGSGNTIANYIPLEDYLEMLDEARSQ